MKLIICMFIMLISAKECDKQKASASSDNISEVNVSKISDNTLQKNMKVTYQALSRGFFSTVTLEGNTISFSNDRNLKTMTRHDISQDELEELMTLLSNIDEKSLPGLEAPSKNHQFDGAAIATLEIVDGEDSYKTVAFDHGNPPESIKAIVEKMLSIKTIIEKQ